MNSGIVALRKLSGAVLNNIFEFQFVLVGPDVVQPGWISLSQSGRPASSTLMRA